MHTQAHTHKELEAPRFTTEGNDSMRTFEGDDHDQHAHGEAQKHRNMDMSHIPGWGSDLEREMRPAVPMEHNPPRLANVHWTQPEQQPLRMKVFHSPERPGVTPVFGTSSPPRGLSGRMREAAYKMTESDIRHWQLLLLADRVDVVEGIGDDIMKGHVPNFLGEMGIKAEFRHNPRGLALKVGIAAAVGALGYYLLKRRPAY